MASSKSPVRTWGRGGRGGGEGGGERTGRGKGKRRERKREEEKERETEERTGYMCSAHFSNMRNFEIALRSL